ncbi:MAG TPA: hypothetical protein VNA25_04585 [Phycisphaerae bacterium]|nr:hypothetical protein [Phycisphaerae bacterium]
MTGVTGGGLMAGMLGRLRRTTRLDVGLALVFSGVSYLVWSLVAGTSREMVREMILASHLSDLTIPEFTQVVKVFFVDMGFMIDLAGLAWMLLSLALVLYSARQKLSISWAWLSAIVQSFVAAGGGVLVGWAMNLPLRPIAEAGRGREQVSELTRLSEVSLPVILSLAILTWVTFLVWLLVERARFRSRGPTLRDGLRTNVYP